MLQAPVLAVLCALAPTGVEAARIHRTEHGPAILKEFVRLLSIPNVAADQENIRRNARWP